MRATLLHGLFPLVRAEVLQLLFANPGQELYVRELARLPARTWLQGLESGAVNVTLQ